MGDVLAWLEAAHAEAARTQRNLPVSATSPTAGGESVAPAEHGAAGATTSTAEEVRNEDGLVVGHPEVTPK